MLKFLGVPDSQRSGRKQWLGGKKEFEKYKDAGYNMDKILESSYFTDESGKQMIQESPKKEFNF